MLGSDRQKTHEWPDATTWGLALMHAATCMDTKSRDCKNEMIVQDIRRTCTAKIKRVVRVHKPAV